MEYVWKFFEFVERFQTLIAALFALLAAYQTIKIIIRQINQNEQHHQEQRRKKFVAIRAVSPLAFSRLCGYAERSLLHAAHSKHLFEKKLPIGSEPPEIPNDIVSILREFIEFANDEVAESTRQLVSSIQIHSARMADLPKSETEPRLSGGTQVHGAYEFDGPIFDSGLLYARAEKFFDYARNKNEKPPKEPTGWDVSSALLRLHIEEENFPEVHRKIATEIPE